MDRIGVAILSEKPDDLRRLKRRATHCNMIARARKGKVFYAEAVNYSCGFAIYTLGLGRDGPAFRRSLTKDLTGINNALKMEIAGKILASTRRLPEGEKFIAFFPLAAMPVEPDVVIVIGNPGEIMNLVWDIASHTGKRLEASIGGIGAMCGELTTHTIVTGEPNLSVGCCGSRRFGRLRDDEIMLSLPWEHYRRVFDASP